MPDQPRLPYSSPSSRFTKWVESLSSQQQFIFLTAVGIVIVFFGLVSGTLFINQSETIISESEVVNETKEAVTPAPLPSFAGEVLPDSSGLVAGVTHMLRGSGGETVAYLTAPDDKLVLVEGTKVEIVGTVTTFIDETPVILVDTIVFK